MRKTKHTNKQAKSTNLTTVVGANLSERICRKEVQLIDLQKKLFIPENIYIHYILTEQVNRRTYNENNGKFTQTQFTHQIATKFEVFV